MGSQSIVYGYIETDSSFDSLNESVLKDWSFDRLYPFTNVFSAPKPGYECSLVSFSGAYKSLEEDWDEWEQKFEGLLKSLYARSAKVHFDDEIDGFKKSIIYTSKDGWDSEIEPDKRRWSKWYIDSHGQSSEERSL